MMTNPNEVTSTKLSVKTSCCLTVKNANHLAAKNISTGINSTRLAKEVLVDKRKLEKL